MNDFAAWQIVVPLLDSVNRIGMFHKEEVDRAIEIIKQITAGDHAEEAALTQFIEAARHLFD
jgi:hypothetical protein